MAKAELKSQKRRTLTKRLVKEAMLDMLMSKGIQDISVTELCNAAGINRTTFYNHYAGTFEVLAEIENEFLARLSSADESANHELTLEEHIETLCLRLQQDKETALLLLANNIDPQFSARLFNFEDRENLWRRADDLRSRSESELLAKFVCGGACTAICSWLKGGCVESPGQVAELLASALQNGVGI